jgi:hypothetical protein
VYEFARFGDFTQRRPARVGLERFGVAFDDAPSERGEWCFVGRAQAIDDRRRVRRGEVLRVRAGMRRYWGSPSNAFDGAIVLGSVVLLVMSYLIPRLSAAKQARCWSCLC